MKAYNYTIVKDHKQKVKIPYINLEFKGYFSLILNVLFVMGLFGFLSLLINQFTSGSNTIFFSLLITLIIVFGINVFLDGENQDSKEKKLVDFYFKNIKRYRVIIDENNEKHYVSAKQKEEVYKCINR